MKIINVTSKYQYIFEDGKVIKEELNSQKGIVTSFLHPKNILSITKKFDKNLSEDTIFLEMEKYVYSYPGVDINKEYKSIYINVERENFKIIEAVLVEVEELEKDFENILKIYKYIDFISPSFLAWEEYYKITKIEPKNDIFIYLNKDEAFLSAFSNGKYLFHKSLNKLSTLQKLLNKNIDEVIDILKTKGLDIKEYENEGEFNIIDKFFSEFFLKVFNIVNFSLNEYQIAKFDRIIFYSPIDIKGLLEQYENYWGLNKIEFKKSNLSTEYDHLEYLITIFNANHYEDENINLTIFSRPPSFFKTKAGKFFIFLFFCLIGVLGYIFYEYSSILKLKSEIESLQNKYLLIEKRYPNKIKLLEKYKKENNKLLKEIRELNNKIQNISIKVDKLYEKAKMPIFYNILAKISNSMQKYSIKIEKIIKNQNHIKIIIISDYDNTKEVTSFMKDLINLGFKRVTVTYIINNSNDKYISKVSFDYE